MTCIAAKNEDEVEQQTSSNDSAVHQSPTCRASEATIGEREHYEYNLEEDQEYFFVLAVKTDPGSFVSLTGVERTTRRPIHRSTSQFVPSGSAKERSVKEFQAIRVSPSPRPKPRRSHQSFVSPHLDNDMTNGGRRSSSPEPESLAIPVGSPPFQAPGAAAAGAASLAGASAAAGSFCK
jgi:hypothetical protein